MTPFSRRRFLEYLGSAAATTAFTALSTASRAPPPSGAPPTGTIEDVEHIVVLMQENRSFDHYFGTLRAYAASATRAR